MRRYLVLSALLLAVFAMPACAVSSPMYVLHINHTIHMNYGYVYPVTYEFTAKALAPKDIKVYYRYSQSEPWNLLPKKSWKEFYNGIYCYRVEPSRNQTKIYVSVGFKDPNSDKIYLFFTDLGMPLGVTYINMTKYYDNRTCAVTATADDWCSNWSVLAGFDVPLAFQECCECFIHYHVYLTAGVITQEHPPWKQIQKFVNTGYICIASHSRTHPHVPYANYTSEIGGSYHDIITHLHLSWWYRLGKRQYVYAWLEPYGECDAQVRHYLGVYHYLADRLYPSLNFNTFAAWDSKNHLFDRAGFTIAMQNIRNSEFSTTNSNVLNASFDKVYKEHGIYHLMLHPYLNTWTKGNYAWKHLAYISGRHDVWYVPFGILYLYHWATIGGFISVKPIGYSTEVLTAIKVNPKKDMAKMSAVVVSANSTICKVLVDRNGDGIWDYASSNPMFNVTFATAGIHNVTIAVVLSNGKVVLKQYHIKIYFEYPVLAACNIVDQYGDIIYTSKPGVPIPIQVEPSRELVLKPVYFSSINSSGVILVCNYSASNGTILQMILNRAKGVWASVGRGWKYFPSNVSGDVNVIFMVSGNGTIIISSTKPLSVVVGEPVDYILALAAIVAIILAICYFHKRKMSLIAHHGRYFRKVR